MKTNNRFGNALKPDRGDVILWLILSAILSAVVAMEYNIVVAVMLGIMLGSYVIMLIILTRVFLGWIQGLFFVFEDKQDKRLR